MTIESHRATLAELTERLDSIRNSPSAAGTVQLIVRRPATNEREVVQEAELSVTHGLVGDDWIVRGDFRDRSAPADPNCQITIMNSRLAALVALTPERWSLAGDQLYVDLDLSRENLPAGTQLRVGTAVLEVTSEPHNGCRKFSARFGSDALQFVNSPQGKQLRLRGLYARVVQSGVVRQGDAIVKLTSSPQKLLF